MATNGIEILIDVLSSEAVTSTDQFIKVITDAADKVGILSGTVGELDTALSSIATSSTSAEEMSARLVVTLENFGINVKDADPLAAAFADTLKGLGASGEKAAAGIETVAKANEGLIGPTDAAAAAIDREGIAAEMLALRMESASGMMKGFAAKQVAGSAAAAVATADLGAGFAKMTTLSEMATPALMKAATYAGLGLAGLAYEGIKQYTEFNKLITQTITQAGVAPSKMGFLTNLAESVAKSTGQNLNDVANSIYRAASGTASWNNGLGATGAQLANIVTQVSKLNVVGAVPTGAASEQASRVITALINSDVRGVGHDPAKAAALVNAAVGSGDMRLPDLVPGVGRGVLSSAVANNVAASDMLAWIATLTSQGTTASVAGNYVKTGMNLLMHPSAQGVQALAMIGIKPGELQNIVQGPGGLTAVLETLKAGMSQLNPSSAAQFFYHEAGVPRKGGGGLQGAVAKLQTWSAGELSQKFINDWIANKLTSQEQVQAYDLILTKAFGGSKQFATIAGVTNKLPLFEGILKHLNSEFNVGYFNQQVATTEATPAQQFKRMQQSILVNLVNIGKTLTPIGLAFGHAVTGIIDGLSKFKGVLYGFVGIAASLLAFAGAAKVATIATHIAPFIGAGYNRLAMIAGQDSVFSKKMLAGANGGASHFINIYDTKKHGILSKLGGEAISAGFNPVLDTAAIAGGKTIQGLSQGENALNATMSKGVTVEEKIAISNQIIADAVAGKGLGGGGLGRGGTTGIGSAEQIAQRDAKIVSYAPQFKDPVTGRFLSAAESAPLAARMNAEANAAQTAALYYGATGRGRGVKSFRTMMHGGASTALENIASTAAERGVTPGVWAAPESVSHFAESQAAIDTMGSIVPTAATDIAKTGMMSSLASGLGTVMGGPLGMIGMMVAPALIGALTPALGRIFGSLFSGGTPSVYHPHLNNPLDTTQVSAKIAAADKILHQYEDYNKKTGKWTKNIDAYLAHPHLYDVALKNDQLARGLYAGALLHSNATTLQAVQIQYGSGGAAMASAAAAAKILGGQFGAPGDWAALPNLVGSEGQMYNLAKTLPPSVRSAVLQMMYGNKAKGIIAHGANWKDFSTILGAENASSGATLADAVGHAQQYLEKHDPALAALNNAGYFTIGNALSTNNADLNRMLNDKHATAADKLGALPDLQHIYQVQRAADVKALAAKGLNSDAKVFLQDQKTSAQESLNKVNTLISELTKSKQNTKLDSGSVSQLAKQNASELVASRLPDEIANAMAKVLSPFMKTPRVVGTSGPVSRSTGLVGPS